MGDKRSNNPNKFFTKEEKEKVVKAIQNAENKTSGEIRLHLEKSSKKDPFERALELFEKIDMHKTDQRNGVLIYLATGDRKFTILGDEGINNVVPENFWKDIVTEMSEHFKQGDFSEGICIGIKRIGEKLKAYFPYQTDDVNELSDDISISDNSHSSNKNE